ncbi:MAG TPA: hypothetical protein ENN19_15755 [Chloroflexi bacterium]|nr:hypothetical protein [Chloroflexota bacterium]
MNRRNHRLARFLFVPILLLALCRCTGEDATPETLFRDDFDTSNGQWGVGQFDKFERGYDREEYFIDLYAPDWLAWASPGLQFDDVVVEVDAYLAPESSDGHFGVLCRYVDEQNFYYFAVSPNGYYGIFLIHEGIPEVLTGQDQRMAQSSLVQTEGLSKVRAVCYQSQLSLYVNGELIETVLDDTLVRGDVGLGVGSGPEGNVRAYFDNFVVTKS